MADPLTWGLQEQVVHVCGTAFWYKPPLHNLLSRAGVPPPLIQKYKDESKFKMVRLILAELDAHGDKGIAIQRKLTRELASMRVTDPSVNRKEAEDAVATLRSMAQQEGVLEDRSAKAADDAKTREHRAAAAAKQQAIGDQRRKLEELCQTWRALIASEGKPQQRGYDLEALIGDLFRLYAIEYRAPYRKSNVEQTDGFFRFGGLGYLIEARWRKDQPTIGDLTAFSGKVERKINSTRGLFVSYPGFRDAVLTEASNIRNVIYMSGEDLTLVLEDRVPLIKALEAKDEQAARFGVFYFPLTNLI